MSITWNSYPNIPYMGILPCGIANFGGDTQIFTIDPDTIGAATSPIVQLNPIANAMLSQSLGTWAAPNYAVPDMTAIQEQAKKIADEIGNKITTGMTQQSLTQSKNNLSAQKTKLNSYLNNSDLELTDNERTEINRLLDAIQEQEKKITELSQKLGTLDAGEAFKQAQEIETEIRKIVNDSAKIQPKQKAKEEAQPGANEPQGAEENTPVNNPAVNNPPTNTPTVNNPQATNPVNPVDNQNNNTTPVDNQNTQAGKITDEHRQIADAFHDAIAGLGTDDETFNALFDEGIINKDNIVEVMAAYEEAYGASFMDDFMDDADSGFFCAGGQKVKYGKAISRMLRARAIDAGIYDACKEDLQKINKEMDSTFYISNGIYENYDNVAAMIAAKEDIG